MKIIPVLDILNGVAVHAVRGIRKEYKPLRSVLCASSRPSEIACVFNKLGFAQLYIADLDAISGKNRGFSAIEQIADANSIELIVDGGVSDLKRARELLQIGVSKIVVGTETLSATAIVGEMIRSLGKERILLSLDLLNGQLLSNFESKEPLEPLDLLRRLCNMGLTQVIVLDLARVGSGEGVNMAFLKQLLRDFDLEVFVGGGVRNCEGLLELRKLGVDGVLLATALHSGAIRVEHLVEAGMEF